MAILNLIDPAQSDIAYTRMIFPDGQPHIKLDMASVNVVDKRETLQLYTRIANPADLLLLLFTKNTLDYLEFEKVELYISYLMTARMDRVMLDGEPFSLKVVASMLNTADFKKISIFDPHSEVSTALINRSYAITNHRFVKDVLDEYLREHPAEKFCLVSPDAGALKKIHKLAAALSVTHVVECMKERDVKTGALISFKTTEENLSGITCVIVDDICDGGGTFAGTAKMLREKGAGKIVLVVSHGIFSKGVQLEAVDKIYSTNSYRAVDGIRIFDVIPYLY